MGAFWASVPDGTTSATGAKSRLIPAARSSLPQRAALAFSTAGARVPWLSAEGMADGDRVNRTGATMGGAASAQPATITVISGKPTSRAARTCQERVRVTTASTPVLIETL